MSKQINKFTLQHARPFFGSRGRLSITFVSHLTAFGFIVRLYEPTLPDCVRCETPKSQTAICGSASMTLSGSKNVRFPGFAGKPENLDSFPVPHVHFAILEIKIPVRRASRSFQESSGISLARHNRVCKLAGLVQSAYRKQPCLKRPVERSQPLITQTV